PQRRRVRQPTRGPRRDPELADRVQHAPPPPRPGRVDTSRLRGKHQGGTSLRATALTEPGPVDRRRHQPGPTPPTGPDPKRTLTRTGPTTGPVSWYNAARLHQSLGYIPPAEYEQLHARRRPIRLNVATV